MSWHDKKVTLLSPYIGAKHVDDVIAGLNAITASEMGFESFTEMRNVIATPVNRAQLVDAEHRWHQVDRRTR